VNNELEGMYEEAVIT